MILQPICIRLCTLSTFVYQIGAISRCKEDKDSASEWKASFDRKDTSIQKWPALLTTVNVLPDDAYDIGVFARSLKQYVHGAKLS